LALFVFFRVFFVVFFFGELDGPATELIRALWVGVRFDLRLAVFIIVPVGLFFMIPFMNPMRSVISRQMVNIYLRTVAVLVTLFYAFDMAHYGYLNHRIDVSAFKLLENPMIALQMVWESYPVVWSIIGLSILIWATWEGIENAFEYLKDRQRLVRFRNKFFGFTNFIDLVFWWCVDVLQVWGDFTGLGYNLINILIFILLQPALIFIFFTLWILERTRRGGYHG
jgi:hypothetical protein